MDGWHPWHGCKKYSEGCLNCYVYRRDLSVCRDPAQVAKTSIFRLPLQKKRDGSFALKPGQIVYTCLTSDFFLEEADPWRPEAWEMIKSRSDLTFFIITKRILRAKQCLPGDWGEGYPNVILCCTVENQRQCGIRMPEFLRFPARRKEVICEPLLGPVDFGDFLQGVDKVTAGGESGNGARPCRFEWVLDLRRQCLRSGAAFSFKQTGAYFIKDGKAYHIDRKLQMAQAKKAGIDLPGR